MTPQDVTRHQWVKSSRSNKTQRHQFKSPLAQLKVWRLIGVQLVSDPELDNATDPIIHSLLSCKCVVDVGDSWPVWLIKWAFVLACSINAMLLSVTYLLNTICIIVLLFNSSIPGKMAAISQTKFSDAFLWMNIFIFWFEFHWKFALRVQLTISQHWFR